MLIKGKDIRILHVFNSESLCHQDHLLCYRESRSPIFNYMKQNDPTAPAGSHLVCWGPCSPQRAPSQWPHKADTEVGHSWETHGSSDDDFGLRATEDSSQLCFFLVLPQSFFQQTVSFFPLSFTLGQTCIVVGWVSSFFSSPLPNFHSLFFPLFPEQFNPILISAYLRTQMNVCTIC